MKSAVREITCSIVLMAAVLLCGQGKLAALLSPALDEPTATDSANLARPEQQRVPLVSVAASVHGLVPVADCAVPRIHVPAEIATGAVAGYLPVFSDTAGDMVNSWLFQTSNGYVGIGTNTPDQMVTVAGAIHSTTGGFVFPDGSKLLTAPAAASVVSGNLLLAASTGAGGAGNVDVQTVGDIASTMSDRLLIAGTPKAMTGAVPSANIFSVHLTAGDAAGGKVKFTIVASDGTNYAMETGEMIFLANPNAMNCAVVVAQYSAIPPTYTNTVLAVPPIGQSGSLNAQCLGTTFGSDPGLVIFDTNPTNFTATTHKIYYTIENQSQAAVTLQP